jgi:hypothetical protein
MRLARLLLSAALVTGGTVGGVAAQAGPAHAVPPLPTCDTRGVEVQGPWIIAVPKVWKTWRTDCTLRLGDRSEAVLALEYALEECNGLDVGTPDTYYDRRTENAVYRLERKLGIPANKIYGPPTRDHMDWIWSDVDMPARKCQQLP